MIHSAGVAVIDWAGDEPCVLCVRSYGKWDFPKGKLDAGESHIHAACRELEEETGINVGRDAALVGVNAPPVTYRTKGSKKKTATYFLADRTSDAQPFLPVSPELGHPENDAWEWIPVSRLSEAMPARLQPVVAYINDWIESD